LKLAARKYRRSKQRLAPSSIRPLTLGYFAPARFTKNVPVRPASLPARQIRAMMVAGLRSIDSISHQR
jgi:hypothetical protein